MNVPSEGYSVFSAGDTLTNGAPQKIERPKTLSKYASIFAAMSPGDSRTMPAREALAFKWWLGRQPGVKIRQTKINEERIKITILAIDGAVNKD